MQTAAGQQRLEEALPTFESLLKLVFLDMGLAVETYLTQRERTIREQQEAIRKISTPVLPLRERLLLLPIIGAIDPLRACISTWAHYAIQRLPGDGALSRPPLVQQ